MWNWLVRNWGARPTHQFETLQARPMKFARRFIKNGLLKTWKSILQVLANWYGAKTFMSHLLEHFTKSKIFHSMDYEDHNIISFFRFLPLCLYHGKHGCILNTFILYLLFIYTCRYDTDIDDVCTYGSYRSR